MKYPTFFSADPLNFILNIIRIGCVPVIASLCLNSSSLAAPQELSDDMLSQVVGEDGVTIHMHLQWNANSKSTNNLDQMGSIKIGFFDATSQLNTYFVLQGFGGTMDMWGLQIDAIQGPYDVGDVVKISMPYSIGFKQFGVRGAYTTTAPDIEPKSSYGQWVLNGSASLTGGVYIWPAK